MINWKAAFVGTLLVLANTAYAVPVYYTFEGYVRAIKGDQTNAIESGVEKKDRFTVTFMVDRDAQGSKELRNGRVRTPADNDVKDFFSAELVDGGYLLNDIAASSNRHFVSDFDLGFEHDSDVANRDRVRLLDGSRNNNFVNLRSVYSEVSTIWSIGSQWRYTEVAFDGDRTKLFGNMRLVDISNPLKSNALATPLPAALPLFLSGLIALGFWRRKASK